MLHRNALQMLTIAKATFPGSNFDNHLLKMDCTKPSSSGDELACMWRRATHMLRRADDFRSRPEDILAALLEVSHLKLPLAVFDKALMKLLGLLALDSHCKLFRLCILLL